MFGPLDYKAFTPEASLLYFLGVADEGVSSGASEGESRLEGASPLSTMAPATARSMQLVMPAPKPQLSLSVPGQSPQLLSAQRVMSPQLVTPTQ